MLKIYNNKLRNESSQNIIKKTLIITFIISFIIEMLIITLAISLLIKIFILKIKIVYFEKLKSY